MDRITLFRGLSTEMEFFTKEKQSHYNTLVQKALREKLSRNQLMQLRYLMRLRRSFFTTEKEEAKKYADPFLISIQIPVADIELFDADYQNFQKQDRYLIFTISGTLLWKKWKDWKGNIATL